MERKIGEIFEYNGEWYQCVRGQSGEKCIGCSFKFSPICIFFHCLESERKDHTKVIFKKLEKVGEPYELNSHLVQKYRFFHNPSIQVNGICILETINTDKIIEIGIKQTKEDMEEKKLNLKPFDIQKAREGKPVCTRDGHKARIICFDYNGETGDYPIVALVHYNKGNKCYERVLKYTSDGLFNKYRDCQHDDDLMMLSEKRSGWVKIRKDVNLYNTKEEADRKMIGNDEYVTAKVCWEE